MASLVPDLLHECFARFPLPRILDCGEKNACEGKWVCRGFGDFELEDSICDMSVV